MNSSKLPSGWVFTTIGEITRVDSGIGFPEIYQGKKDGDFPFYKVMDISKTVKKGGIYLTKSDNYISLKDFKDLKAKLIKKDSLVFAKIGAAIALNRRVILSTDALVDNNIMAVNCDSANLDGKYIYYFFLTIKLGELSRATTVPSIRKSDVENISMPLPPFKEQHRIVTKIEELFTQLDAGVASLKKVQAQLKHYRRAVMKAAFEGRLTQEWRIKHPEIPDSEKWVEKLFSEKGKSFNVDTFKKTHILPKKWISVDLGALKLFSLYGPRFSSDDYSKTGFFVIRTSDINESGKINLTTAPCLPLSDDEFSRYKVEKGDLLITRTGSLGTLALFNDEVNAIPGAYLIQYRLFFPIITNWYIFYFLQSPIGQQKLIGGGSGVGRPNLNAPKIDSIQIPLPPLEEQREIVSEIERNLSIITHVEQLIQINLSESDLLRQSILKRAFEGKLVPQDPNDEPASGLLERIKAEKTRHATETKKGKTLQPKSPKRKVTNGN